jgi:hypothetical protein
MCNDRSKSVSSFNSIPQPDERSALSLLNYQGGSIHANNSDVLSKKTCLKLFDKCFKQKTLKENIGNINNLAPALKKN